MLLIMLTFDEHVVVFRCLISLCSSYIPKSHAKWNTMPERKEQFSNVSYLALTSRVLPSDLALASAELSVSASEGKVPKNLALGIQNEFF